VPFTGGGSDNGGTGGTRWVWCWNDAGAVGSEGGGAVGGEWFNTEWGNLKGAASTDSEGGSGGKDGGGAEGGGGLDKYGFNGAW
jgi:hypothetical protein